jgi:hypothetical protein
MDRYLRSRFGIKRAQAPNRSADRTRLRMELLQQLLSMDDEVATFEDEDASFPELR